MQAYVNLMDAVYDDDRANDRSVDCQASAHSTWDTYWESDLSNELQLPDNFFEGADPMIDINGLGQSWMNIQEWADASLLREPIAKNVLEGIALESRAAGSRFCCYGMVSSHKSRKPCEYHVNVLA